MSFTKILIILIVCFFLIVPSDTSCSVSNEAEVQKVPIAIEGVMDVTDWDWEEDGIIPLNGQWEFYWQELYLPEDFKDDESMIEQRELITLPRAWNKYVIDEEELSGHGYATYRLIVNHEPGQILGLDIPRVLTSYNLWINGELRSSAGRVSTDSRVMIPQYLPQVKYFKPETNTIEIVIQVANYRHRSGGILDSIKMGSASQINSLNNRNLALELFLFGSLFIIGFYHLALYIFRTKDKSTLFFGIYSLLISLRTLLVGEIFLIHLFPEFNWEIAHKIQSLSYYIGVPLVILFLESLYPEDISRRLDRFIKIFASLFGLLVLLTPVRIFSWFNPLYQAFSFFVFLYALYIVILTCYRKREGSYFIGIGVVVLILCTVNDIIFHSIILADTSNHLLRGIVTTGNLSSWGLLIFVFTQSLVLAQKFSRSFVKVESLTDKLQQVNAELEEKVRERTFALQNSKKELNKAYQAVSRSKKSLQDLIQNMSHDLRTPLSAIKGYADAILDGIVKPQQQSKYLNKVIEKVNYLNHMVQELFDLSQLQARQSGMELVETSLRSFIKGVVEKYSFDMMNKNRTFKVHYPSNWHDTEPLDPLYLEVDMEKLERVFTNLLNNACKYSDKGSHIDLSFDFMDNREVLYVEIRDNGIGISQEDLPHIFERFYRVSKVRQVKDGSGLGLAIVKEIIEYHNGHIWVESEPGVGSKFSFTIPVYNKDDIEGI